jgi:hypothetical protein
MSKFLKILEQVDPQNTDKQEMIHKLAELFNLISSVEVSSDGDSITVNVNNTPVKLTIVDETNEEEAEENPGYSIDTAVQSLAQKPSILGDFGFGSVGTAKKAVKKRDEVAVKAISKYDKITKNLEKAIKDFDAKSAGFNVTR